MSRSILPWPDRFWARTELGLIHPEIGPCAEWVGARFPTGYGKVSYFGHPAYTHRVAYQITVGPIPTALNVLHHCDNPPCVRVDHLFLGTDLDNAVDREAKGRGYFSRPGALDSLRAARSRGWGSERGERRRS